MLYNIHIANLQSQSRDCSGAELLVYYYKVYYIMNNCRKYEG